MNKKFYDSGSLLVDGVANLVGIGQGKHSTIPFSIVRMLQRRVLLPNAIWRPKALCIVFIGKKILGEGTKVLLDSL